jgi:hypothetical protein
VHEDGSCDIIYTGGMKDNRVKPEYLRATASGEAGMSLADHMDSTRERKMSTTAIACRVPGCNNVHRNLDGCCHEHRDEASAQSHAAEDEAEAVKAPIRDAAGVAAAAASFTNSLLTQFVAFGSPAWMAACHARAAAQYAVWCSEVLVRTSQDAAARPIQGMLRIFSARTHVNRRTEAEVQSHLSFLQLRREQQMVASMQRKRKMAWYRLAKKHLDQVKSGTLVEAKPKGSTEYFRGRLMLLNRDSTAHIKFEAAAEATAKDKGTTAASSGAAGAASSGAAGTGSPRTGPRIKAVDPFLKADDFTMQDRKVPIDAVKPRLAQLLELEHELDEQIVGLEPMKAHLKRQASDVLARRARGEPAVAERHVLLSGPMGSGKSTAAALLTRMMHVLGQPAGRFNDKQPELSQADTLWNHGSPGPFLKKRMGKVPNTHKRQPQSALCSTSYLCFNL